MGACTLAVAIPSAVRGCTVGACMLAVAIPSAVRLLSLCSPSCCTLRLECFCPSLSYQFIQPHTLWLTLELLLTLLTQKVR